MGAVAIEQPTKTARLNRKRVRDGVATAVRLSNQVFTALQQKRVLITVGLVMLLVDVVMVVVGGACGEVVAVVQ